MALLNSSPAHNRYLYHHFSPRANDFGGRVSSVERSETAAGLSAESYLIAILMQPFPLPLRQTHLPPGQCFLVSPFLSSSFFQNQRRLPRSAGPGRPKPQKSGMRKPVWRTSPVRGFSASACTPTSMDVRPTMLMLALKKHQIPHMNRIMKFQPVDGHRDRVSPGVPYGGHSPRPCRCIS